VKRLILFLILLYAIPVQAASWLDARDDYAVAARVKLGIATGSTAYLSDSTASLLFNEAATLILPINRGIKRITQIVTTTYQDTYTLDTTLIGIEAVRWTKRDSSKPLVYLPVSQWSQAHNETLDKKKTLNRPSFYDFTDSLIVLYPSPTHPTGDTIEIWGWHRLGKTDTDTLPTQIYERYRLAILYHMVWNFAKSRQDPRAAEFKEELQLALTGIGMKMVGEAVVPDTKK